MQYAHEFGCPWHEETCSLAFRFGRYNIVLYAQENSCPGSERYPTSIVGLEALQLERMTALRLQI